MKSTIKDNGNVSCMKKWSTSGLGRTGFLLSNLGKSGWHLFQQVVGLFGTTAIPNTADGSTEPFHGYKVGSNYSYGVPFNDIFDNLKTLQQIRTGLQKVNTKGFYKI